MEQRVTVVALGVMENPGRKVKSWIRETARGEALFHGKKHIPLHFARGAATRYGYKPRSATYLKRFGIRRGTGQWRPLVLTGRLRDAITKNQEARATSTKGATLVMTGETSTGDSYTGVRTVRRGQTGLKSFRVRLRKNQRFLSKQQEVVLQIKDEITAITSDELDAIEDEGRRLFAGFVSAGITAAKPRKLA